MFNLLKKDVRYLFTSPNSIQYVGLRGNLKLILYYYFISILFILSSSVFFGILKHFFINQPHIVIPKNITFLKVAIVAPIMEEILFRLVIRVNKSNIILFVVFLIVSLLYETYILTTTAYYIFIGGFSLFLISKKFNHKINSSFEKNNSLPFLIYFSCLLFGLFHLSNFKDIDITNITVITYLISKILDGFVFILLRLKFGIIASILLHIFINSLAYILISY
ncbi:type II CAAX prenyl endopeptidase Rce1 family protein [Flavobacterium sp. 140616W15]|uniref:CPBP family glutamic-type intramembrane protease n=1 Tax=Flavobacterium sp. 140616W15 TaxID=2478552 RepID=UPI000F0C311F|nr:CPBP family intramembrane metalloprotease [Flavobacterium sp. 140616W15]